MIILGSSSPRRKDLLSKITTDFKIINPTFDERTINIKSTHYALEEAYHKALSLLDEISKEDCLICVDTIVVLDNKIYGKPVDKEDAKRILLELSNKTHKVITGYIILKDEEVITNEVTSLVTFNKLDQATIDNYIESIDVLDKAGAYSYQDDAKFHLIKEISGSYSNIMGFPVEEIESELKYLDLI